MKKNQKTKAHVTPLVLPDGQLCSVDCCDCIYFYPRDRDDYNRRYCAHFREYIYPSRRRGCWAGKQE